MTKVKRAKIISALIEKWRPVLFLGEWHFDHRFVDDDGPESETVQHASASAEISVNYPYKRAAITTYRGFWSATEEEQDSIIAHEMCHCHTQELWDMCTDFANGRYHNPDQVWRAVETLTQRISIIAKYGHK